MGSVVVSAGVFLVLNLVVSVVVVFVILNLLNFLVIFVLIEDKVIVFKGYKVILFMFWGDFIFVNVLEFD